MSKNKNVETTEFDYESVLADITGLLTDSHIAADAYERISAEKRAETHARRDWYARNFVAFYRKDTRSGLIVYRAHASHVPTGYTDAFFIVYVSVASNGDVSYSRAKLMRGDVPVNLYTLAVDSTGKGRILTALARNGAGGKALTHNAYYIEAKDRTLALVSKARAHWEKLAGMTPHLDHATELRTAHMESLTKVDLS